MIIGSGRRRRLLLLLLLLSLLLRRGEFVSGAGSVQVDPLLHHHHHDLEPRFAHSSNIASSVEDKKVLFSSSSSQKKKSWKKTTLGWNESETGQKKTHTQYCDSMQRIRHFSRIKLVVHENDGLLKIASKEESPFNGFFRRRGFTTRLKATKRNERISWPFDGSYRTEDDRTSKLEKQRKKGNSYSYSCSSSVGGFSGHGDRRGDVDDDGGGPGASHWIGRAKDKSARGAEQPAQPATEIEIREAEPRFAAPFADSSVAFLRFLRAQKVTFFLLFTVIANRAVGSKYSGRRLIRTFN